MKESKLRSIAKTASWRFIATASTFLISWWITGNPVAATGIASLEFITKIILYYYHERGWAKIKWGKDG